MLLETIKQGVEGSIAENTCRSMLSIDLPNILGKDYITIVGINDRSIILPYEIDIPIIVFEKGSLNFWIFAVEFNGQAWHTNNKNDTIKIELLRNTNCHYIAINHNVCSNTNEYTKLFKEEILRVCNEIKKIIKEGNI